MNPLNSNVILHIEIKDLDLITKLNYLTSELSISLEDFILVALDKLINDINFVRDLRNFHLKQKEF